MIIRMVTDFVCAQSLNDIASLPSNQASNGFSNTLKGSPQSPLRQFLSPPFLRIRCFRSNVIFGVKRQDNIHGSNLLPDIVRRQLGNPRPGLPRTVYLTPSPFRQILPMLYSR